MTQQRISFVGAGNMAQALIHGLLQKSLVSKEQLVVTAPSDKNLCGLREQGIFTSQDNKNAVLETDIIIIAVKPQKLMPVLQELNEYLQTQSSSSMPLFVSVVAGVRLSTIAKVLGQKVPIVRAIPNTPAIIGLGATGLLANHIVSDVKKQQVDQLFAAVGEVTWLDDELLLDAVTALSGSGPAYFFIFIEALIKAGQQMGLSKEQASILALKTAQGSVAMASEEGADMVELRRQVTSPGGTTEQAIASLNQEGQWFDILTQALRSGANRSAELAENAESKLNN